MLPPPPSAAAFNRAALLSDLLSPVFAISWKNVLGLLASACASWTCLCGASSSCGPHRAPFDIQQRMFFSRIFVSLSSLAGGGASVGPVCVGAGAGSSAAGAGSLLYHTS